MHRIHSTVKVLNIYSHKYLLTVFCLNSDEELRRRARERVEEKLGFYIHLVVYCAVNVLLFFLWYFFTLPGNGFPWFLFPLVFWGIGLLAHGLTVFARTGVVDRMTEEEYRKLKENQNKKEN
jgi:hypothetical protein